MATTKQAQPARLEIDRRGPRQRVWEAIRWLAASPGTFTAAQLADHSNVPKKTVWEVCSTLMKGGFIEALTGVKAGYHRRVMRLVRDNGIELPRLQPDGTPSKHGLAQEQMWRTLSLVAGDTNAIELAAHASTPAVPVTTHAAEKYLVLLERGGFVQRTKEAKSGPTGWRARFRLCRRTGPKPPVILEIQAVYDPNVDQVVHFTPTSVEEAIDVAA